LLVKDAEEVQEQVAVDAVVEQAAHPPVAEVGVAAGAVEARRRCPNRPDALGMLEQQPQPVVDREAGHGCVSVLVPMIV
jgi:hypothetical protein